MDPVRRTFRHQVERWSSVQHCFHWQQTARVLHCHDSTQEALFLLHLWSRLRAANLWSSQVGQKAELHSVSHNAACQQPRLWTSVAVNVIVALAAQLSSEENLDTTSPLVVFGLQHFHFVGYHRHISFVQVVSTCSLKWTQHTAHIILSSCFVADCVRPFRVSADL